VRIHQFLLEKRRMAEEAGRPRGGTSPTLESVREYVALMARKRSADEQAEGASSAPISEGR
jgi:hypothetical protein